MAGEGPVARKHAALLGVEQEDQAEDDREQPAIDIVGVAFGGERFSQKLFAGGIVSGLEPSEQVIERVHDLLGKPLADLVLIPAAVREQRSQAMFLRPGQQALFTQEKTQRRAQRTTRGLRHVSYVKVHPAGAFAHAERRRDAAQRR